jgi:hypothetical protein
LRGRSSLSRVLPLTYESVTRSSWSAHLSCFTNTLFVVLFEPRDVGHTLSDSSWVNVMHEELENFERNQV